MEVKMFKSNNADAVAIEINDWLAANDVAVRHITQSQCEHNGRFIIVMSVFYESKTVKTKVLEMYMNE